MALGRWRNFVEANMQAILHYWYSLENVLSMEEAYSLHRLLTDRIECGHVLMVAFSLKM